MSDHDAAPDPMDKAYAQAEAVLNDEAARAARRARVLAAVAREPASTPAASSPPARRAAWRHGGWLVAASVAGLSILLSTHIDAPSPVREPAPPTAQSAPAAPTSEAAAPEPASLDAAAPPPASAGAPAQAPEPEPEARVAASRSAPPSPAILPPAPPPPPLPPMSVPRAPEPFPAAAPPAPAEGVVTAQRRAQRLEEESKVEEVIVPTARMARPNADYAGAPAPGRSRMSKSAAPSDDAARLHAAAASGRTAELSDLLADGIPVDALDAEGETALMKSIQAGQPAAAAVLRRHGASLDRRNRDGESARDMATAADDAELDRALGLDR